MDSKLRQMIQKIALSLCLSMLSMTYVQAQQVSTAVTDDLDQYKQISAPIPAFSIETSDGHFHSEKDIPAKSAIVVLFNPTCDHCQDLAKDIVKHKEKFEAISLVFIGAKDMKPYLDDFIKATGLKQLPHAIVGADRSDVIYQLYEFKALPQTNVYTEKHTLKYKHNGSISAKELLSIISGKGK